MNAEKLAVIYNYCELALENGIRLERGRLASNLENEVCAIGAIWIEEKNKILDSVGLYLYILNLVGLSQEGLYSFEDGFDQPSLSVKEYRIDVGHQLTEEQHSAFLDGQLLSKQFGLTGN